AGAFRVVVVHVGLDVTHEGRIVIEALLNHHVRLILIQAIRVLDGVTAGKNRVLLSLSSENVAGRFVTETVSLVDHRLQYRPRIRQNILSFAGRCERVSSSGKQFDPVHPMVDVIADGRASLFYIADDSTRQRILGGGVRCSRPDNSPAGYLKPRAVEAALV